MLLTLLKAHVQRYNADGTPDASFSGDGIATLLGATAIGGFAQVVQQPDGKHRLICCLNRRTHGIGAGSQETTGPGLQPHALRV